MGCGGSTEKSKQSSPANNGDGAVTPSNYDRRPKISVRCGPQAKKLDKSPVVVFIFGGPGSRKGRVVDDLKSSYGFKHVCTEEIIHTDLPMKVSNVIKLKTAREVKEFLEADPTHVSPEWILNMAEKRIERDHRSTGLVLIDFVPNLKYMLKMESLSANMAAAMTKFEERYPVSFALNLAIPTDKVLKAKQVLVASQESKERLKETGGQGDEADAGRVQRRAVLFNSCVKPILEYFSESDRLVTVDVSCGVADLIWHRVHELLCVDLDLQPARTVNTVILFAFEDKDAAQIDYDLYLMEEIRLQDSVERADDSVENLLKALSKLINDKSRKSDSFVVHLAGTSVTKDSVLKLSKKIIMFHEVDQSHIEKVLPGSPKNYVPSPSSTKYKIVCSTENEICLFPPGTDDDVCKCIASVLAQDRLF